MTPRQEVGGEIAKRPLSFCTIFALFTLCLSAVFIVLLLWNGYRTGGKIFKKLVLVFFIFIFAYRPRLFGAFGL